MALDGETGPDAPESHREALARATTWLSSAIPWDLHQDKVLKVLLGKKLDRSRAVVQISIDELFALQRVDGGWSQTVPEMKSDAFATGQTLYALSYAGYTSKNPEVRRGIDFLVATQLPVGE